MWVPAFGRPQRNDAGAFVKFRCRGAVLPQVWQEYLTRSLDRSALPVCDPHHTMLGDSSHLGRCRSALSAFQIKQ